MAVLLVVPVLIVSALAAPPDLTNPGDPAYPSADTITKTSINLGPSGLKGWVYREKDPKALLGDFNYTGQSRQILVSAVDAGSPGSLAGIQIDDVILGASGDGSTPVDFTADARKSLALAIAAAEARTTPELKLKVWRGGSSSTYTLTLQYLGAYGPDAPVSDAKCDLIAENARQALLAQDNPGTWGLGTLALMALDDPAHPDHAAMKAQIDAEIAPLIPVNGLPGAGKPGWQRGHTLITLAEYYLNYGEHPNGGVFDGIQAYVDEITAGQSVFGTFGHIFANFRWPDGDPTPMMGGYGAINSSAVPGLYGLMLAKECGVTDPALDLSIERGLTFYGSYKGRGVIPYGEHEPAATEFTSNGKSGAAALVFGLAAGKEEESKYFAKMSAAGFREYETGHTGCYFQNWWTPLGAAHGGDDAIKNYFAEISWLYDLARKWDGSFAYNHIYTHDNYTAFNNTMPYVLTYALPLKRLHMTGRGRAAGVLNAAEAAEAHASGSYDETARSKAELIADLGDWSAVVHVRASNALAAMTLDATDIGTLHALASDPVGDSREGAIMTLEKVADPSSAPVLSALLGDPDAHIRRLAAKALIDNPAKDTELNTVLAAAGASKRATFPMDPRDPLHHDLYRMGNLLFSSSGILGSPANGVDLTGVDRQLLYPAIEAIAYSPSGIGRSSLSQLFDALNQADVEALGDTVVDSALYRSPADPMFADGARVKSMDALVRFDYAEAAPIVERSIRADFIYNANRDLYGQMLQDLQAFAGTNALVRPDPEIRQLCQDFIATHSNTFAAENNVLQAQILLDLIQQDDNPPAPTYLKSFDWVVSDAAELTLPANSTRLRAGVTDHAKGELTYTWRQVHGSGTASFSENGTATAKDTTITFDNTPGHYLFEVAVVDARGLSEITGTVAVTLYDTDGTLPPNQPPTATAQQVPVPPATPTAITLAGNDPEGAPLVFTVTSQPLHGSLSGTAPDLTYTSDATYHTGTDHFNFAVTDSFGQTSQEVTVTITIDPAQLEVQVYEPFDYPAGAGLAGAAGGTGMTGAWQDGPQGPSVALVYDESGGTGGTPAWDGIFDGFPMQPVGGSRYIAADSNDVFEACRPLAQDAGTMAGPDGVLWMSAVWHFPNHNYGAHVGLALATDSFADRGRQLDTSGSFGSGAGDGIGVGRGMNSSASSLTPLFFDGGAIVAETEGLGLYNADWVVVLKFEFGATDTVTAYAFPEGLTLDEGIFDRHATSTTHVIDESTLNMLTFSQNRDFNAVDEIRIGSSFAAVAGLATSTEDVTAPTPDPLTFAISPTANGVAITMTATTATDPNGVEYYFTCTSGSGNDSGWQDSPTYTDTGLSAGTYSYTVTARDKSINRNMSVASAPEFATISSVTPGQIAWEVFDISGSVTDVITAGSLVEAHGGADLGTGNVVDGSTFDINGVTFDDGFVFDSPSHLDTIGNRGGSYSGANAAYGTLMSIADRRGSGNATFTFTGLTPGSTYQIQVWHGDNVSTATDNGMVVNDGGIANTPVPGTPGHATLIRETSEGGYGQYAIGTFVADSTTQQFLARAYGGLNATPSAQSNTTINGCQLRLTASAPDATPPTLASSDIVDDRGGAPAAIGEVVVYEVTFSEDMDGSTISHSDFGNAGAAAATIGTVVEVSPSIYQVRMTPQTTGTLQLQVNSGAAVTDLAGNPLDTASAILDDTTITVGAPQTTVPNVVGLAQATAEADIVAASLVVGAVTSQYDAGVPAGIVISQNPGGGNTVDVDSAVDLVISLGPPLTTVPDVVAQAQATAEASIVAANLVVGAVTSQHDSGVPTGAVISQNPAGGSSVAEGTGVDLVVSLGPPQTTVPDVVGLAQAAAESDIVAASLVVGTLTSQHDEAVAEGDVISQTPAGGSTVDEGTAVDLVVSLGPAALTPGEIAWQVFDISGNVTDISTDGTLVQAHGGADLGTGNVVDGTTFDINGVTFDDGFVFDSPSHLDTIGTRGGSYSGANAAYATLMKFADRQSSGTATFTFTGLTPGSTYQIQVWHGDNVSVAMENGMVVNNGGMAETPVPGTPGHATLIRETAEGGYGQYAIGTFIAASDTQQFLARAYGGLTATPVGQANLTINGCQLRLIESAPDTTPPTLAGTDIVDDRSGSDVTENNPVIYTVTFSEDMDEATVDAADFSNAGSAPVTIGTVTETSPGVFSVGVTPTAPGSLQLQVSAGAMLADVAGNPLDTTAAIVDDTTMTVNEVNVAPVWTADPVNEADATEDSAYASTLADDASDGNTGDSLEFAKVSGPAWLNVALDGTLSGTPTNDDVGANAFVVSVTDTFVPTPVEATLNITVLNTNDAPAFTADPIAGADATEDAAYAGTLAGSATDEDGDTPSFAKVSGPAWLVVDPNGTLSGTPDNADVGLNAFTVSADDGNGGSDAATLNITVVNTNDAPVFTADPIAGADATEDAAYAGTLAGSATDGDGDTPSYAKVSGPSWLVVDPNGTLSGTPGNADVGLNAFTVSAHDGNGGSDAATLNITVHATGAAFVITPVSATSTSTIGAPRTIDAVLDGSLLSSGGASGDILSETVSYAGNEGHWLSAISAVDDDANFRSTTEVLTFTLAGPSAVNAIHLWPYVRPQNVRGLKTCDLSFSFDGGSTYPVTIDAATLGDFLIGPTGGTAPVQTKTFAEQTGVTHIRMTNLTTFGSTDYIAISELRFGGGGAAPNTPPVWASDPVNEIDATEDAAYVSTLADDATDAEDTLSFAKVSGPAWLNVAADGALSGTPTNADVGANVFTVSADDGTNPPVQATLNIAVIATTTLVPDVTGLPQATAESNLVAASLAAGTVTQAHSTTVPAGDIISQGLAAGVRVAIGSGVDLVVSLGPDLSPKLVRTTVTGVSNTGWTTVGLGQSYNSPVIVATPIYPTTSLPPVVTRITNTTSSGFDLKIDRADGLSDPVSIDVSIVVVDEGVYTQAVDGVTMEAAKFTSTVTARKGSWVAEARTFQNSYTNPVVVGQVMSANDPDWSVFWSMGSGQTSPVDASNLNVGKHVGEDPNSVRADETIGYIVIEAGSGTISGVAYEAALGADTVRGLGNSANPYTYGLSGGLPSASSAAASVSGMDGGDGSWAVLSGSPALTSTSIGLHACEDQLGDSEQNHTTTQVGYLVFE